MCKCTKTGALVEPPPQPKGAGMAAPGQSSVLDNLCDFTCSRGYCPPETCTYKDELAVAHINPTLRFAILMAQTAQENLQSWGYYETFFSQGVRNRKDFAQHASLVYKRVVSMLDGSEFDLQITCDNTTPQCQKENPDIAYMNAFRRTVNICDAFFSNTKISATPDKYAHNPTSIVDAHHTRAAKFAMLPTGELQAKDYAYGWESCKALAE
ncbi:hypothetical protein KXW76_007826, partial [Aspergillus fumigatus]